MTEKEIVTLEFNHIPRVYVKPKRTVAVERKPPTGFWNNLLEKIGCDRGTYHICVRVSYAEGSSTVMRYETDAHGAEIARNWSGFGCPM